MIDKITIQAAKAVDINKVLDKFNWGTDITGTFILCPNPLHDDHNPSVSINCMENTCRCFTCRQGEGITFDTINLYQSLCEKVDGRRIPFPQAVKEVLALDGMTLNQATQAIGMNQQKKQNTNKSAFDTVIRNSKPLTGYELNYLHSRGIMLYDAYVYQGKIHTKQSIDKELQAATDKQRIEELEQIKQEGKFFKGIAPILKANRIQIKHNYWQGVNSILYYISYDGYEDEDLQTNSHFLVDTERNMAIKKSMDSSHQKQALGEADFCFLTEGMDKKGDIYICEGMEDSLSYTMNGEKSISLNSIANVKSLIEHLEHHHSRYKKDKLVISLDHDEAGEKATQKLVDFFEAYNQQHPNHPYKYGVCQYPQQFHDINDYWVSKIKEM